MVFQHKISLLQSIYNLKSKKAGFKSNIMLMKSPRKSHPFGKTSLKIN